MTQFSGPSGLDELLNMMDLALGNKKSSAPSTLPVIYPRITVIRSWLTERTHLQEDDYYDHYYQPPVGMFDSANYNKGFIIHNHTYDRPCATPHFCFELGYQPSKDFTFFWLMNGKYYGHTLWADRPSEVCGKESLVLSTSSSDLNSLFSF